MKDHLIGINLRVLPGQEGVAALSELRKASFAPEPEDEFDAHAEHLIVDSGWGPEAAVRFFVHRSVDAARRGYTGAHYDLSALRARPGPYLELGRLCFGTTDPGALRALYGALAQIVLARGVRYLFGCTSLPGADPLRHRESLACLAARFADPLAPKPLVDDIVPVPAGDGDPRALPPLFRSYLSMGARVGPVAVVDRKLDTLHLFTGLDPTDVPASRRRSLRRLAVDLVRG